MSLDLAGQGSFALEAPPAAVLGRAFVPEVVTKDLAVGHRGDRRRVVLSSNFLRMFGFEPGVRHSVEPLPGLGGLRLACDPAGSQQVYERSYASRRNNPFEAQVHLENQALLDAGLPGYTERVHFELRQGEVLIRPLANRTFGIRRKMANVRDLAAFVAMTSGVDVRCLADCGFRIDSVLEYRPREKRDQADLTETGALNVLANARPRVLINEDISKLDMATVERLMADGPPVSVLHLSLQCDDFSTLKSAKAKAAAVESLETSADLVYDGLRLIETVRPAVVMVEQVAGFATSPEGRLLAVKLGKWGYHVSGAVLDARDHGGLTSRARYYLVASVWPGFEMPAATPRQGGVWPVVESYLAGCRDVSHTKAVADGVATGRIRLITPESAHAPTVTKSQARQTKDSVYVKVGGRYYLPSQALLARLNGLPADFSLDLVNSEVAAEIVGQSVDVPMHEAVARAVRQHIEQNAGRAAVVNVGR